MIEIARARARDPSTCVTRGFLPPTLPPRRRPLAASAAVSSVTLAPLFRFCVLFSPSPESRRACFAEINAPSVSQSRFWHVAGTRNDSCLRTTMVPRSVVLSLSCARARGNRTYASECESAEYLVTFRHPRPKEGIPFSCFLPSAPTAQVPCVARVCVRAYARYASDLCRSRANPGIHLSGQLCERTETHFRCEAARARSGSSRHFPP